MRAVAFVLPMLIASVTMAAHVKVSAVADRTAIEPGGTATIALKFKIDPGWHLYWINPGETGLPPRVKWTLPPGVTAGPLQFPTPERIAGPVTAFGYHDDLVLLVDLSLSPDVKSAVEIAGKVSWVVCADECVAESQQISLALPVGKPVLTDAEQFKAWAEQLPGYANRFTSRPPNAIAEVSADGKQGVIDIPIKDGCVGIDFFPPAADWLRFDAPLTVDRVFRTNFHVLPGFEMTDPGKGIVIWKNTKSGKLISQEIDLRYRYAGAILPRNRE